MDQAMQEGSPTGVTELLQNTAHYLNGRQKAAILTMDVKGAFNRVKTEALVAAMKRVGVPTTIIKWTRAFLSNRTAKPRRNGVYGREISIPEGLSQGSPASPILFAILLADIGREWPKKVKIFADDIQILSIRGVKTDLQQDLETTGNEVIEMLQAKGLETDPGKNQLLVRDPKTENLSIRLNGHEVVSREKVTYLGTIYDSKGILFKSNSKRKENKALNAIHMLARFSRQIGGMKPKAITNFVKTVIMPTYTYGGEIWQKAKGHSGTNDAIDRAITMLIKKTLRLNPTTPSTALQWEMDIPTTHDVLEEKADRWTHKLGTLGVNSLLSYTLANFKADGKLPQDHLGQSWRANLEWGPRERPDASPKRGHPIEQTKWPNDMGAATLLTARDPFSGGWRTEIRVYDNRGRTSRGVKRTGPYTTAHDAEIGAAHLASTMTNNRLEVRASTPALTDLLEEATTSLNHADKIRELVQRGKMRIIHDPEVTLDNKTKKLLWTKWPVPDRYTSQRFIKE